MQLLGAVMGGGIGGQLLFYRRNKRKADVETTDQAMTTLSNALAAIADLQVQLQRVQAENTELREQIKALGSKPLRCDTCPLWRP